MTTQFTLLSVLLKNESSSFMTRVEVEAMLNQDKKSFFFDLGIYRKPPYLLDILVGPYPIGFIVHDFRDSMAMKK